VPNVDQMLTVLAPLKGAVTAIAVTTTATSYDLQQGITPALGPNSGRANKRFYGSRFVRLHADGGAVYYLLADVSECPSPRIPSAFSQKSLGPHAFNCQKN
jgi:hypothetical protein